MTAVATAGRAKAGVSAAVLSGFGAAGGLEAFKARIGRDLFTHSVITDNAYARWFAGGLADETAVRDLIVQFSVFSNYFLVIQAKRLVFAQTQEGEDAARAILVNELGVGLDPRTGSAEGKIFSARNAHLNWLRQVGAALGIAPMELGRWSSAAPETRAFLEGLEASYASEDACLGAGASFAVENWAAFDIGGGPEAESRNFWRQLISGLEGHNENFRAARGRTPLPLGFFKYHFLMESGHGAGVWRELEADFGTPGFDEEKFLAGGRAALDALGLFWKGLDARRFSVHT
ncbi:MAG: hypothetical protein KGL04_08300 [Elusimicrobia bacterium]|nr:hypothetical protein [Elusimicrobiota bacterium]